MEVNVYNTQKRYPINLPSVQALTKEVITAQGRTCHEVTIHFVGTRRICSLHAEYFNDPSVTDCISFPIDSEYESPYSVLGEVFVRPETASCYVKKHGGLLYEEITLYIIHGLMHLMGYDDIAEADCIKMREREQFHMNNLRAHNLLLK